MFPENMEFEYRYLVIEGEDKVVWSSDVMRCDPYHASLTPAHLALTLRRSCRASADQSRHKIKLYDEDTNPRTTTPRTPNDTVAKRTRGAEVPTHAASPRVTVAGH